MIREPERPFLLRALYFVFVGWWLTFLWINVAWAFNVTFILLPLGLWMIDRVPQVLTLKPMPIEVALRMRGGRPIYVTRDVGQHSCLVRLLYFAFVGWWLSLIWANVAWVLCVSIIGLPLGILMFNALPAVTTLMRTA